ncbi:MAG: ATP-binding cassette domain-containing protein, partial [Lawsonibacter sp.]|nr:ATP-binding cassette domain-containing protein [Lawsonibacter sp.]
MGSYQIKNLIFSYPGQAVPALSKINLTVGRGEFFTLFGPSGGGKTTLLRQLKPALTPHGSRSGSILFQGHPLDQLDPAVQASAIGFVLQSPEEQIVTDKVWHELAFGLESLGLPRNAIRTRVAEMAAFFGIEDWFHRDTASLSGGQKQLLNLASVMVMGPEVLLLDEPTSQLDPIAAQTFLDCLARLNRELGTTILLSEHRLEDALPLSTRCALLDGGQLLFCGTPREAGSFLRTAHHPMFRSMPTPMRVWAAAGQQSVCPITPGEGRRWLEQRLEQQPPRPLPTPAPFADAPPALEAKEVWFRYDRENADVLRGLTFSVPQGALCALLGGNGAGKTTLFSLLTRAKIPQRGALTLLGRPLEGWPEEALFQNVLAALPQNPKSLFVGRTVAEDLADMGAAPDETARICSLCRLNSLLDSHPYDLSGGEQQRAALAKVLLARPKVLLLDEPTKGMDAPFKETFARILSDLRREGVTILMASHDVGFCARYATCCALLFDGSITAADEPHAFFSQNRFYTTAACRMTRGLVAGAITAEELTLACGGTEDGSALSPLLPPSSAQVPASSPMLPKRHVKWLFKPLGALLLALLLLASYLAWRGAPLLAGLSAGHWLPSLLWLGAAAFGLWLLGLGRAAPKPPAACPVFHSQRTGWPTIFMLLILMPFTLWAGTYL